MGQIIGVIFMIGVALLGAVYLFEVISGKRKSGDYKNIDSISGFGAM